MSFRVTSAALTKAADEVQGACDRMSRNNKRAIPVITGVRAPGKDSVSVKAANDIGVHAVKYQGTMKEGLAMLKTVANTLRIAATGYLHTEATSVTRLG